MFAQAGQFDPSLTPDAIGWLAGQSSLPVLIKGVLRGDDAVACLDAGAAGVVVSNHGGRQLDTTVASADALAEVVEAVGARGEVYVDGGIRRGTDVVKALALGARGALSAAPSSGPWPPAAPPGSSGSSPAWPPNSNSPWPFAAPPRSSTSPPT